MISGMLVPAGARSPVVQAFLQSEGSGVDSADELPTWFARQVAKIAASHGATTLQVRATRSLACLAAFLTLAAEYVPDLLQHGSCVAHF